jgi:putative tricarboxylic transport membrane protein
VLGPLIEKHLREGLFMSRGDISVFWTGPIAVGTWLLVGAVLLIGLSRKVYDRFLGGLASES